jgi:hypothetical protein
MLARHRHFIIMSMRFINGILIRVRVIAKVVVNGNGVVVHVDHSLLSAIEPYLHQLHHFGLP